MIYLQDNFKIYYGIENNYVNIKNEFIKYCINNQQYNLITIPANDTNRTNIFGDPLSGVLKNIKIINNNLEYVFDDSVSISLYIANIKLKFNEWKDNITNYENEERLKYIHNNIKINYGSMLDEYIEQSMVASFLDRNAKVLEIGGNIGRNSIIIASILNDETNFVVLETNSEDALKLEHNKNLNYFNFHVENAALSYRKLIQRGWDTYPSDVLYDGFFWVNTITFEELTKKYNIMFDTLVADCEGALYYILKDNESVLDNIHTIIVENDYHDYDKKLFVEETYIKRGFKNVLNISGGWGPCYDCFYQVWKK